MFPCTGWACTLGVYSISLPSKYGNLTLLILALLGPGLCTAMWNKTSSFTEKEYEGIPAACPSPQGDSNSCLTSHNLLGAELVLEHQPSELLCLSLYLPVTTQASCAKEVEAESGPASQHHSKSSPGPIHSGFTRQLLVPLLCGAQPS